VLPHKRQTKEKAKQMKLSIIYILETFDFKRASEIFFLALLLCSLQLILFEIVDTGEIRWFDFILILLYILALFLIFFSPLFYLLTQCGIPFELRLWMATMSSLGLVSVTFQKLSTVFRTYYKR